MRRETEKKLYKILHFAVAISIILIGVNVLVKCSKGTVGVVKDVSPKVEYTFKKIKTNWKASKKEKRFIKMINKTNEEIKDRICTEERIKENHFRYIGKKQCIDWWLKEQRSGRYQSCVDKHKGSHRRQSVAMGIDGNLIYQFTAKESLEFAISVCKYFKERIKVKGWITKDDIHSSRNWDSCMRSTANPRCF